MPTEQLKKKNTYQIHFEVDEHTKNLYDTLLSNRGQKTVVLRMLLSIYLQELQKKQDVELSNVVDNTMRRCIYCGELK